MKKVLLIIISVIIAYQNVNGQTNVSGVISTNTNWTLANSPYIVTNSIDVSSGVTLTIDAGVVIKFNQGKSIQIDGTLIARGTANNYISFTSNSSSPNVGDWGNILFTKTSVSASLDMNGNYLSGTILEYCIIEYGGSGSSDVLQINGNGTLISPFINYCDIRNNQASGIYISNSASTISNTTIESCVTGISIQRDNTSPTIINSLIKNNSSAGITIGTVVNTVTIKNNIITNNSPGINCSVWANSVIINSNRIVSNKTDGIQIWTVTGTLNISNNVIADNLSMAVNFSSPWVSIPISFTSNQIIGNGINSNTGFYQAFESGSAISGGSAFEKNIFAKNHSTGSTISIASSQATHFDSCNFLYNTSTIYLLNKNVSGSTIAASNNYWGTNTESLIKSRIYDWNDDANLGIVNYTPYLNAPYINAPISPTPNIQKQNSGNSIVINWSANPEANVSGYKVYYKGYTGYSFQNVIDVGNVTTYTLPAGLTLNDTIAITAYNSNYTGSNDQVNGYESWYSLANSTPNAPTNLAIDAGPRKTKLSWTASSSSGVNNYNIYRSTDGISFTKTGSSVSTNYIDSSLTAFQKYYYRITAFDSLDASYTNYGLESGYTSVVNAVPNNIFYASNSGNDNNIGSATNPLAKIQTSINRTVNGDTVIINSGTYLENLNITDAITIGSKFILTSDTSYISAAKIDGTNYYNLNALITATNNINFKLVGVKIQNATSIAIQISSNQSPQISKCIFYNNGNSTTWGTINLYGNVLIDSCYFIKNIGRYVIELAGNSANGFCVASRNIFEQNGLVSDSTNWQDRSIFFIESRGKMINNLIFNNYLPALSCGANGAQDTALVVNNTIYGNKTVGLYFDNWGGGTNISLINNVVENNPINIYYSNQGHSVVTFTNNFIKPFFYNSPALLNYTVNITNNDTSGYSGFTNNNIISKDFHVPNTGYSLINRGAITNAPSIDIEGNPRPNPVGTNPDLGAYESIYNNPSVLLSKTEPGNNNVSLFWSQYNPSNISSYRIYRSINQISDTSTIPSIATITPSSLVNFIDSNSNLINKTVYYYRMKSVGTDGNWSGFSNQLTAVPNLVPTPTNLKVDNGPHYANLNWDTIALNNIKYQIFRDTDSTQRTKLIDSVKAIKYQDTSLVRNTIYYYRIRTIDSVGAFSLYSPAIVAKPTNIWYVDSAKGNDANAIGSIKNPFKTIQAAINSTLGGDSVFVNNGTYLESININTAILVKSINGASYTSIIEEHLQNYAININNISFSDPYISVSIKGFTIISNGVNNGGNGIRITQKSFANIESCIVKGFPQAISTYYGYYNIKNSIFYSNNTFLYNDAGDANKIPIVQNSTVVNTTSSITSSSQSAVNKFYNTIITNDASSPLQSQTPFAGPKVYLYNVILDTLLRLYTPQIGSTVLNVNNAQALQFYNLSQQDFRLANSSPAIGFGNNLLQDTIDINGNVRPNPSNSNPDAGAYENVYEHPAPFINNDSSRNGYVLFKWNQNPLGTVNKFYVYKGTDSINTSKLDSTGIVGNYTDSTNQLFNTILYYRLTSIGTPNLESGYSNEIKTIAFTAPILKTPTDLLIKADTIQTFSWSKIKNATKYRLQYSLDSNFVNNVIENIVVDTSYTKAGLTNNTSYFWRLQTWDSVHYSTWSKVRRFQTLVMPPIFTNIKAGNKRDTLIWQTNASQNIKYIRIYRDTINTPTIPIDSVSGTTLQYIDTINLKLNKKYYYRLVSFNYNNISSVYSNVDSATPYNRSPIPISLTSRTIENAGENNFVRLVNTASGSYDPDGKIVNYKWYVNDSLVNNSDSILIYYYPQGLSIVKLVVQDNDSASSYSTSNINVSAFVKRYSGGILGGITALNSNILYVADSTYDPASGASIKKIDSLGNTIFPLIVSSKIFTTPSVSTDSSVFITSGSSLNGFSSSGAPLWPTIALGGLSYVTPTIDSILHRIYVGVSNSNFFAIDYKTGNVMWNINCDAAINSSAVITGDRKLVFASQNGTLYGFNLLTDTTKTVTPQWKSNIVGQISTSPAVDANNNLYFGTSSGKLVKVSLDSNGVVRVLWNTSLGAAIQSSPVIDASGYLYVGNLNGQFSKLDPNTGNIIWTYQSKGAIISSPSMSDYGNIYIADNTGYVSCLSQSGFLIWKYKDSSSITANLLTINAMTYIGTKGGKLIAFYDNPNTNTVNTSISFNLNGHSRNNSGGLASVNKFNTHSLFDAMLFTPPPSSVQLASPVWGTYQGNYKRTGSKSFECPTAPLIYIPNCIQKSDSIQISTSSMIGNFWVINDSVYKGVTSTSIMIPSNAKFQILATNQVGCNIYSSSTNYIANSDISKPTIITNNGRNNFCNGDSLLLTSSIQANKYRWNYAGFPLSGANNISIFTTIPGAYSIAVINSYGCTSLSDISLIQSVPPPSKPVITWNGSQFSTNATNVTYQWLLNNVAVAGAGGVSFKPLVIGNYKVQITDANGCKNISDSFALVVTAINNPTSTPPNHIAKLFPNPASSEVFVEFNQIPLSEIQIQVIDNYGRIIHNISTKNQSTHFEVADIKAGIYYLRIIGKDYNQTQQLIITK